LWLLGLLLVVAAVVAMLSGRTWVKRLSDQRRQVVRWVFIVLTFGMLGADLVLLVTNEQPSELSGLVILLAFATGALLMLGGLALWAGQAALSLRFFGWSLMVLAAAVPSTISLSLPLLAALALTLVGMPRLAAQSRSTSRVTRDT
jgi:prolipoprotein diacylglyceryltransferase